MQKIPLLAITLILTIQNAWALDLSGYKMGSMNQGLE